MDATSAMGSPRGHPVVTRRLTRQLVDDCRNRRTEADFAGTYLIGVANVSCCPAEPRSESSQELTIRAAVERGPRFKAPLRIQLVREVDVRFAVQQVSKIDSCAFQVHRIDLEVAPIERAVGVVVI